MFLYSVSLQKYVPISALLDYKYPEIYFPPFVKYV